MTPTATYAYTFTRDGQTFICAWHPGFDKSDSRNVNASHGLCDGCSARLMAEMGAELVQAGDQVQA